MRLITPARVASITAIAAIVVFCAVQDRVTAAGVTRYVDAQRAAIARGDAPVSIDGIMRPAVRHSVTRAAAWSGVVALAGGLGAAGVAIRSRRG